MIIDVHNHYYPPEYLDALEPSGSTLRITHDAEGNPIVHYPGDYNVMVRGHRDIAYRQHVLDEHGVDLQVISLTTPGTHVDPPAVAARLSTITNDAFARVRAERGKRFLPLATLPLCDPAASVKEFRRATEQLNLPGAMLFSNVNGIGLDHEQFWPLYEAANDRGGVLMIHPTYPVGVEAMQRLLADAVERIPVRHDARRLEAGLQRRRQAVSAHPMDSRPPRRDDSIPCRASRSRLAGVQRVPRRTSTSRLPPTSNGISTTTR